MNSKMRLLA